MTLAERCRTEYEALIAGDKTARERLIICGLEIAEGVCRACCRRWGCSYLLDDLRAIGQQHLITAVDNAARLNEPPENLIGFLANAVRSALNNAYDESAIVRRPKSLTQLRRQQERALSKDGSAKICSACQEPHEVTDAYCIRKGVYACAKSYEDFLRRSTRDTLETADALTLLDNDQVAAAESGKEPDVSALLKKACKTTREKEYVALRGEGLTQLDAALRLRVSQTTISRIERTISQRYQSLLALGA
jgi:DNA-directed RNA polymerase specialized sigma subunit